MRKSEWPEYTLELVLRFPFKSAKEVWFLQNVEENMAKFQDTVL